MTLTERLFELKDPAYRDFQVKLIPSIDPQTVIGVRLFEIRRLAKNVSASEAEDFLSALPHRFYDENMLHCVLLSGIKDCRRCMELTERFLPYVDNWAVCDTLSPKCFSRCKGELIGKIRIWAVSGETYTVRFGLGMLMRHYLDVDFKEEYLGLAASVRSEEYYVNMMIAWYFATALAKQWDSSVLYISERRLPEWVHNKAIQKACESYRVPETRKEYLRSLRIKHHTPANLTI